MTFSTTPTQWLQVLNRFLPNGLNMNAAETPLWGNLNQVGPFKAIRHHYVHKLLILKQVLAVCEISSRLGEPKERLIEVKTVMEVAETVRCLVVLLVLVCLAELIVVSSAILTRQDLWKTRRVRGNSHSDNTKKLRILRRNEKVVNLPRRI